MEVGQTGKAGEEDRGGGSGVIGLGCLSIEVRSGGVEAGS